VIEAIEGPLESRAVRTASDGAGKTWLEKALHGRRLREASRQVRVPRFKDLAELKGRAVRRERAPGEAFPAAAGHQDARGSREDHAKVKRVDGVLDLVVPTAKLVDFVEKDPRGGSRFERSLADGFAKPSQDRRESARCFAEHLLIQADEENAARIHAVL